MFWLGHLHVPNDAPNETLKSFQRIGSAEFGRQGACAGPSLRFLGRPRHPQRLDCGQRGRPAATNTAIFLPPPRQVAAGRKKS